MIHLNPTGSRRTWRVTSRAVGGGRGAPGGARGLTAVAVPGLPLFSAGDDLAGVTAQAIRAAGLTLEDGDVVVVAQKVVSKVEGRARKLAEVTPGPEARDAAARASKDPRVVELLTRESQELMRVAPGVIISRHRTGHVLANAGIDASNLPSGGEEQVLLWPQDPDASARRLRAAFQAAFGVRLAVVVSDSLGRAWRIGTTGAAIGVAGMKPLRDRRGETDLFGRTLEATIIGVADEIAGAASLVMGEAEEGTPVAIIRGATYIADDAGSVIEMLRPLDMDLFR
jgi:coenzyme F420-0:L-glutamate ligase/coenzyme F420-1:gamma-L-glutamate ligase